MLAVYANCQLKVGKSSEFEQIATELTKLSRQDKGCIAYHVGKVSGENDSYSFVEFWQSQADLDLHMQQPHFIQAGEKFAELLAAPLDIKLVELQG